MSFTSNILGIGGDSSDQQAATTGLNNVGQSVIQAGAPSTQESNQYSGSFDIGELIKKYLEGTLSGQNQEQNYQNQGPLSSALYTQTLKQAQDPTAGWQNTLAPQLQQAQDQINKYYNSRGLLDSGIAIGKMGEAGVDLAIKNAQNEMAYQQQSLQNANALSTNISGLNQQNIQNLQSLYGTQQQSGQNVANRNLQAVETAAGYQAYPYQAQLGDYYGAQAAARALPGQLIGAGGQLGAALLMG